MIRFLLASTLAVSSSIAFAQSAVFVDDFTDSDRTSVLWGNERGNWNIVNGAYGAGQPSNNPLTFSSMPFVMTRIDLECNIRQADDGGIWLRVDEAGLNGVLLVFARGLVYWHHVVNGNPGAALNAVSAFTSGQTLFVRATVDGDTYSCFVNGSLVTSYSTSAFPSGLVGLYDFRAPNHNYDNLILRGDCPGGDCCPVAFALPQQASVCPQAAVLTLAVAGSSPLTLQWQVADAAGQWRNLVEGLNVVGATRFTASGIHLTTLDLESIVTEADLRFRCAVTGGCGTVNSDESVLRICPADFNCDGGVDGDDVIAFFEAWDSSSPEGDFNGDEGVDGDDVIAFFARWDANC